MNDSDELHERRRRSFSKVLSKIVIEDYDNESDTSEESIPSIRGHEESTYIHKTTHNFFQLYWRYLFAIIWPLLASLIFLCGTDVKIRCLYVELVMWVFWAFHILPEGIIALIPIFALPLMTIQHTYTTCTIFFQYGFLALNTTLFSICLEYSGLHERVILFLIWKFGGTPRSIHSVISVTSFLISIRFANVYTSQLVLPILRKILYEIDISELEKSRMDIRYSSLKVRNSERKKSPVSLSMAFMCSIVYSVSLGGINFVSGTIANFVFKASFQRRFPLCNIAQTPWYCYAMPIAVISFLASLVWVQILHLGLWRSNKRILAEYKLLTSIFQEQQIVKKLYYQLGTITLKEIAVAIGFIFYLSLWYIDSIMYFMQVSSDNTFVKFIATSTPFFIIAFILMVLPANLNVLYIFHPDPKLRPKQRSRGIMPTGIFLPRVPWSRILVLGACVAMSQAQFTTGLAKYMASKLYFLKNLNYWALLFIVTTFGLLMTETCSNYILCGVFTPLVIELSILSKIHPIYLGIPFTLSTSLSFLHEWGSLTVRKIVEEADLPRLDFFITGTFPKFYTWLLIYGTFHFYGKIIFHEDVALPKNYLDTNVTCYCEPCPFNKVNHW